MTLYLTKISTLENYRNIIQGVLQTTKEGGGLGLDFAQWAQIDNRITVRNIASYKIMYYEDETPEQAFRAYLYEVVERFKLTKEAQAYYSAETFRPFDVNATEETQTASGRGTSAATNTEKYNAISTSTGKITTETYNEGNNTQNTESERKRRTGDEWERLRNFEGKDVFDVLIDAILAGLVSRSASEYNAGKVIL
ncbi:MAG: hypothetical protein MJ072_00015 [Clostridia bacterium]|nr:hypothetical protein [Clostridia bacterium]